VFILAFAVVMLNTDLHSPNIKEDRRMKLDDFVKNLKGIDKGQDVDRLVLVGIYNRVKEQEFRSGSDHVAPVVKVERSITGKDKPVSPVIIHSYKVTDSPCRNLPCLIDDSFAIVASTKSWIRRKSRPPTLINAKSFCSTT
jgi:hypothetical protein